jgi:hypothetical protein
MPTHRDRERWLIPIFALTVFSSAFLLFQVQPLISKLILPWFGGSPAVWTAAMLFFQSVLFGGYAYAHLTTSRLSAARQCQIHVGLLAVAVAAVLTTRIMPPVWLRPTGAAGDSPLAQIFILLGVTVGLPYFALSSTGPLLQRWFSQVIVGGSPYRLFALSNLGSLLALLSYPLCIEPLWGGRTQAAVWSVGFLVFAVCCGICVRQVRAATTRTAVGDAPAGVAATPAGAWQRAAWIGLPALASVTFLAVTNEVCQNVATVPLLWIVPLSLYLLSFIIAFDHPRWYVRRGCAFAAAAMLLLMAGYGPITDRIAAVVGGSAGAFFGHWWVETVVHFVGLALVLVMCHGELARLKPTADNLTAYYLSMSLGGAIGGLFVNLVAPQVFTTFGEFPLCLVVAAMLAAVVLATAGDSAAAPGRGEPAQRRSRAIPRRAGALLGAVALLGIWQWRLAPDDGGDSKLRTVHRSRNFYGALSVQERNAGAEDANFTFYSGHIVHGRQFAARDRRHLPLTYYGEGSGCRLAIEHAQRRAERCHIGVVGLGVGTLATYARPGDRVRFYEINPQVAEIARNTAWFRYLADCKGDVEVVLGDARLQLERELSADGPNGFDVLCLDAFSGDAIPAHLLTAEAFAIYDRHLRPGGVLAVHITNTYLDLYPVVRRLAEHQGLLLTRIYRAAVPEQMLFRNCYMLLSKDPDFIRATPEDIEAMPPEFRRPRDVPLWTDEYGSLLPLLL